MAGKVEYCDGSSWKFLATESYVQTTVPTFALSSLAVPTANLNLNSQRIMNLADPVANTDAATKQYVTNAISSGSGSYVPSTFTNSFNWNMESFPIWEFANLNFVPSFTGAGIRLNFLAFPGNPAQKVHGFEFVNGFDDKLSWTYEGTALLTSQNGSFILNTDIQGNGFCTIKNVRTPTDPSEVATKGYVDNKTSFNGLSLYKNADVLSLYGVDHAYIQFFSRGSSAGRKAWIGFPGATVTDMAVWNEDSGRIILGTGGTKDGTGKYILEGYPSVTNIYGNGVVWASASDVNTYISGGGQVLVHGTSTTCNLWGGGRQALQVTSAGTAFYGQSGEVAMYITGTTRYIDIGYPIYLGTGIGSGSWKRLFGFTTATAQYDQYGSGHPKLLPLDLYLDLRCESAAFQNLYVWSSQKIKNIKPISEELIEEQAISVLSCLPFYQYSKKDNPNAPDKMGLVAEKLHEVAPEYVAMNTEDFIPNILAYGTIEQLNGQRARIILESPPNDPIEGTRIRLVHETQGPCMATMLDYDEQALSLELELERADQFVVGNRCYVYGTYETCPSIHKNELFELNLIATKNLLRRVAALEQSACV